MGTILLFLLQKGSQMTFAKSRNSEEIVDTGEYWIFKHPEKPDLLWIAKGFCKSVLS